MLSLDGIKLLRNVDTVKIASYTQDTIYFY